MVQRVPFFGRFGQGGQRVLFIRPRAQVNQLATLAAKGAVWVFRLPYNGGVAGGAGDSNHKCGEGDKKADYSFSGCLCWVENDENDKRACSNGLRVEVARKTRFRLP